MENYATMNVRFRMFWNDVRLSWHPKDFGNRTKSKFNTNRNYNTDFIWTPDLAGF